MHTDESDINNTDSLINDDNSIDRDQTNDTVMEDAFLLVDLPDEVVSLLSLLSKIATKIFDTK